ATCAPAGAGGARPQTINVGPLGHRGRPGLGDELDLATPTKKPLIAPHHPGRGSHAHPDTIGTNRRLAPAPAAATMAVARDRTDARYPSGPSNTAIQPPVSRDAQGSPPRSKGVNRRHPCPGVTSALRTRLPAFVSTAIQ